LSRWRGYRPAERNGFAYHDTANATSALLLDLWRCRERCPDDYPHCALVIDGLAQRPTILS